MPKARSDARQSMVELASPEESREIAKRIGATRLFAKYERSFTAASGLPLTIRPIGAFRMPATGHARENPFCALVATSRKGCLACLLAQTELENGVQAKACTRRCYAGLHDTLVPIRVGRRIVAYLQTGQVALGRLEAGDFDRAHSELILRNIDVEAQTARAAFFRTVSHEREAYQGFVKMLEIFAESLGAAANALCLSKGENSGHAVTRKAIRCIRQRWDQRLTLSDVAKASGASERHFTKVFKAETGLTFLDYLTRERVERAKRRISETSDRISEIAFACGFESIAQFNRAFKRVSGESPTQFRLSSNS